MSVGEESEKCPSCGGLVQDGVDESRCISCGAEVTEEMRTEQESKDLGPVLLFFASLGGAILVIMAAGEIPFSVITSPQQLLAAGRIYDFVIVASFLSILVLYFLIFLMVRFSRSSTTAPE